MRGIARGVRIIGMDRGNKTSLGGIAISCGATAAGVALPGEFPTVSPIIWHISFWGGIFLSALLLLWLADVNWFAKRAVLPRILIPCIATAMYSVAITYHFSQPSFLFASPIAKPDGTGGNGGRVGSVTGDRNSIRTGGGGRGGCGGVGGDGGGAGSIAGNDVSIITGSGGDAGGCDGRGARSAPSGFELANGPTEFWKYGRGGFGGNSSLYNRRLSILITIRQEYI